MCVHYSIGAHTTSPRKKVPNYHFHLGLLSAADPPALYHENPPLVFQSSKKNWRRKETRLHIIYFTKYSCGGFGIIWIRKFTYIILHIFYHSLFPLFTLDNEGILPITAPLTCSVLILWNVSNENPLPIFDDSNLKPPDLLPLQMLQFQFPASLNACFLSF